MTNEEFIQIISRLINEKKDIADKDFYKVNQEIGKWGMEGFLKEKYKDLKEKSDYWQEVWDKFINCISYLKKNEND